MPAVLTVVAAVLAELLQAKPVPPMAVNVVEAPEQIVLVPVMAAVGLVLTFNVLLLVAVQPFPSVTVTV